MSSAAILNHPVLEYLFSIRGSVFILGKIFVVIAAFLVVDLGFTIKELQRRKLPAIAVGDLQESAATKIQRPQSSYDIITQRNIFGAGKASQSAPVVNQPISKLKLQLVGVNLSKGNEYAIIEDTARKQQDVFALNETIFGQAKLLEVFPESVKIETNGKIETLVLLEGSLGGGDDDSSVGDGDDFNVDEGELSEAMANLPRLLSQARAVPYFRNGKSVGMRIFAIRKGSLYEKLGLQNGDIIKSVNDNSLSDPSQALKIFEQLKDQRSINVQLERKGLEKEQHYTVR